MSKGITPVVAIILLLLITIFIVGFAMIFFQRTAEQAGTAGQEQLQQQLAAGAERFEIVSIDKNKVYVKNAGTSALTNLKFYVDGSEVPAGVVSIPSGTVGEAVLDSAKLAQLPGDRIKVTSTGSQDEMEAKFYSKNTAAYWRFDEGERAAIKDYSGNGNDGTFVGESWNDGELKPSCPNCPSQTTGKYGNALSFDGVDDYVNAPDSPSLDITQEITIAAWVNTHVAKWDRIIQKYFAPSDGNVPAYSLGQRGLPNAGWGCEFDTGSSTVYKTIYSTTPVNPGVWYHVVCTGSKSGNYFKLYVDGVEKASTIWFSTGDIAANSWYLNMGTSRDAPFNGLIDEVRIYNRALTQQEIQSDMNSAHPIARTVASYSFEKIENNKALDTHNVVKGRYGTALSFDGVDDYIDTGNSDAFNLFNKDFTIDTWINPSITNNWADVVGIGGEYWQGGYTLHDTRLLFTANSLVEVATNSVIGEWNHIAVVHDRANLKVTSYRNSNQIDSKQYTGSVAGASNIVKIGNIYATSGRFFNGIIDEVRILNVAR